MELLAEVPARGERPIPAPGDSVRHCLPGYTAHQVAGPCQSEGCQVQDGLGGRLEQPALQGDFFWEASDRPVLGAGKAVASSPLAPEAGLDCIRLEVLARAAMALPPSPRHPEQLARKSPEGKRTAKDNGHAWGKEAAGWVRCTKLWVPAMPGREEEAPLCKGEPQLALRVHPSHQVSLFVAGEEPLVACLACGSYGSFKAYCLAGRCKPEEAKAKYGRRRALQRLARDTHPGNGKKGAPSTP